MQTNNVGTRIAMAGVNAKNAGEKSSGHLDASITGIDPINNDVCRIRVAIANLLGNETPAQYREAIRNTLGSGIKALAGTFQQIEDHGSSAEFVGLIAQGIETKVVSTASLSNGKMSTIAKNVLMDNVDESVWGIVSNKAGKVTISRQVDEDLSELVAIASHENPRVRNYTDVLTASTHPMEYAKFYNPSLKANDHGYVLGTDKDSRVVIVSRTQQGIVDVDERLISLSYAIHADDPNEIEIHRALNRQSRTPEYIIEGMKAQKQRKEKSGSFLTTASAPQPINSEDVSYTDLREYYKKVFAYDPEYYDLIEKAISEYGF